MDGIRADLTHTWRGLVRHRAYAAAAVLTLALGIGANAAVFNLANWLLLRPLPGVRHQDRLMSIDFGGSAGTGRARGPVPYADFEALARRWSLRGLRAALER